MLAGNERTVLVAEVAQGMRVQQHAERVRDQLQVLGPRDQAPARSLGHEESVLVRDQVVDAGELHQRVTSAQAR